MTESVVPPTFSWEQFLPGPMTEELSFAERLEAMNGLAFGIQLRVGLVDYFLFGADSSLVGLMEYTEAPRPAEAVTRLRVVHKVLLTAQRVLSSLHENSDVELAEKARGAEAVLGRPTLEDVESVETAPLGHLVGSLDGLTSRMLVTFSSFAARYGKPLDRGLAEARQETEPTLAATLKLVHNNMAELFDLCENIGQLVGCTGTSWSQPTDTIASGRACEKQLHGGLTTRIIDGVSLPQGAFCGDCAREMEESLQRQRLLQHTPKITLANSLAMYGKAERATHVEVDYDETQGTFFAHVHGGLVGEKPYRLGPPLEDIPSAFRDIATGSGHLLPVLYTERARKRCQNFLNIRQAELASPAAPLRQERHASPPPDKPYARVAETTWREWAELMR